MQINTRHRHSARRPRGLSSCSIPPETSEMIQREAIEIFTSMVNSGQSFQQALTAVFLSGMSAAQASKT